MIDEKQNKIVQLNKELDEQSVKLERVMKQNAKFAREARQAQKAKTELPEEVGDVKLHLNDCMVGMSSNNADVVLGITNFVVASRDCRKTWTSANCGS